jgi:hypothetical protein
MKTTSPSLDTHRLSLFACLLFALPVVGCQKVESEPGPETEADPDVEQDVEAPPFPEGSGQAPQPRLEYPAGPYGYAKGSVIENFKLSGFANAQVQSESLEALELAMFYNPTGDGVYPEGSLLGAGNPKPKALLINVGSVWCGPCNYEADTVLPVEYAKYKPMGGEFLLQLADGNTPGKPATIKSLQTWTDKYDVDYPATIDPSYKLGALFVASAYPQNLIIDTRTMKIVEIIAGSPDASFWNEFEDAIAGTN